MKITLRNTLIFYHPFLFFKIDVINLNSTVTISCYNDVAFLGMLEQYTWTTLINIPISEFKIEEVDIFSSQDYEFDRLIFTPHEHRDCHVAFVP